MLKIIKLEFKQLLRVPLWFAIFILTVVASIILPRSNLTDLSVVPGMVYFVMVMSLALSIYGSEQARLEENQQMEETLSVTPNYRKFFWGRIIYWLILSALIYLLFYLTVLIYMAVVHHNTTTRDIIDSLFYTMMCWLIPFFYSLIIGYVVYRWFPSIYSYLIIIFIWFMTMPYNSLLGFLPRELSGWMINGDPNIQQIFSYIPVESLSVNKGYYIQRAFMLILLLSIYTLVSYYRSFKLKIFALCTTALAIMIPVFSPYVPYISGDDFLRSAAVSLPEASTSVGSDYKVKKYSFHLYHGESNHKFRYTVDMDLEARNSQIRFALMEDFQIKEVRMNDMPITMKRNDQIVQIELPKPKGILHMEVETNSYIAVGPTTIQLVATSAWYPMNPKEAQDPYANGIKEEYEVYWETPKPNPILTNLSQKSDQVWTGNAYGPTILMGKFSLSKEMIYPGNKSVEWMEEYQKNIEKIFEANNKKFNVPRHLPERTYYVTFFQGMQANPEESYIRLEEIPTEDIRRVFYSRKGER